MTQIKKKRYRFGHLELMFGIYLGFGDGGLRFGDSFGNS
jgi:hypothetical protein